MPEATWNGKAWVTDDGKVISDDPNAGSPVTSHEQSGGIEDVLPALMGTGASMMAGSKAWPGGMAAAGAGGAAGEMLRQNIIKARKGVEPTTSDVVVRGLKAATGPLGMLLGEPEAAAAGAAQAGLEGGGRVMGAAAQTAAKQLYELALAPAMHLSREYGMKNLVNKGIGQKVWPNAYGLPKAERLSTEASKGVTAVADAADAASGGIPTLSTFRAMQERVPRLMRQAQSRTAQAGTEDVTPAIMDRAKTVLSANPGLQTNRQMLDARRVSDEVAREAYDAARATRSPVPPGSEGAFAKSMSEGRNVLLRDSMGQPFKDANKAASTQFGLKRAVEDASIRPQKLAYQLSMAGAGAAVGGSTGGYEDAVKGALIGRALMSPTVQAGAAFAMPTAAKYLTRSGADAVTAGGATGGLRDALLELMQKNTEQPD